MEESGAVTLALNAAETLALGAGGWWLAGRVAYFERIHMPAPIVGGLFLAGGVTALRSSGVELVFDAVLRDVLMLAFFTTVGLRASTGLLRREGHRVLVCLALAVGGAIVQNIVGIAMCRAMGLDPLIGVVAGATTLAGGPATALAFGQTFEKMGLAEASTIGVACGVFGILMAGLVAGPVGGYLVRRQGVHGVGGGKAVVDARAGSAAATLGVLVVAMGLGSVLSRVMAGAGLTLPGSVGAMIVAVVIRFVDDRGGGRLDDVLLDQAARMSVSLFIVLALVTLKLWVLTTLALPLLALLAAQTLVTIAMAVVVVWRAMGRGYEGAAGAAGWLGFMLGTTANAVAALDTLEARHGAAPGARVAVPVVGAFLIDFTNSFVILSSADLVRRLLVN